MRTWARWILLLASIAGSLANADRVFACQAVIAENATIDGNWFASCASVHNRGSYAQYYTFTLTQAVHVQIDLVSNIDSYLYLLAGDSTNGRPVASDNSSGGNSNARIRKDLTPGTYTIEATTYNSGFTGSFRLSIRSDGGGPGCRKVIVPNANESEFWTDACISVHNSGAFARYYTFSLSQPATVQIDLVSNIDSYLYLLPGDRVNNPPSASDNSSGGNSNARIVRSLVAGTYTIEATTYNAQQTGPFQLMVRSDGGGASCRVQVAPNATQSATWTSACTSVHNPGSFARYYTFTLATPVSVQIDLVSNVDSYLYLLAGDNVGNRPVAQDNSSGGNSNARIRGTLTAGTYTIEATTYSPGLSAPFTLSLRSDGGGATCRTKLNPSTTARGNWRPACISVHNPGAYARYYTFTLTSPARVQIDLKSSLDSYLYLLAGGTASSGSITQDNNSGGSRNARITRALLPGTYTIEATTYGPGQAGAFTVRWTRGRSATPGEAEDGPDLDE
jgi:hypothetical protein